MEDDATPRRTRRVTGPLLLLIGVAGLGLGMLLFPSSNLLGGLGPVFGLVCGLGVIWILVGGLTRGVQRLRRRAKGDRPQ